MTIGKRVKAIRLDRNFTQKYIAAALGMSPANYGKFENGKINMSRNRVGLIANLLDIDIAELLSTDQAPPVATETVALCL